MSFTKVKEVLIDIKAVSSILLFIITTIITVIILESYTANTTKDSKTTTETYKQPLDSKDLKGD